MILLHPAMYFRMQMALYLVPIFAQKILELSILTCRNLIKSISFLYHQYLCEKLLLFLICNSGECNDNLVQILFLHFDLQLRCQKFYPPLCSYDHCKYVQFSEIGNYHMRLLWKSFDTGYILRKFKCLRTAGQVINQNHMCKYVG